MFNSDKERYLSEPVNSNHGNLVTSTCDLPCDIPEEWLSDLVNLKEIIWVLCPLTLHVL